MADKQFVDVGDELIVRVEGYPVGTAQVVEIADDGIKCDFEGVAVYLPLDFVQEADVDGVAHGNG